MKRIGIGLVIAGLWLICNQSHAVLISNGISGDGQWQVDVMSGGESRIGNINPTGSTGLIDIIYDYFHYFDVGADGGAVRLNTGTPLLQGNGHVTSSGTIAGQNGTISWNADSWIDPGSPLYLTEMIFTSLQPFGVAQLIQYLDEDVLGFSDDNLIVIGTAGANDFQLLTIDDDNDVGVSQAASYNSAIGMSYQGWAARPYNDLQAAITGGGATYSVAGEVTGLSSITDGRFPGLPAYGPDDITTAIAFNLDPTATYASVLLSMGGSPDGTPTPPPSQIPEPASLAVWCLLGSLVVCWWRKRKLTV